jgi:hypothetical protein
MLFHNYASMVFDLFNNVFSGWWICWPHGIGDLGDGQPAVWGGIRISALVGISAFVIYFCP